ncbi:MAG: protein translocase subunit SecD [Gemmatimonadota bacterium]|nr:protein translocase subunit SecD [Gemmatimonadota bacterium]
MFDSVRSRVLLVVGLLALCGWALVPKEGPNGETVSPLNLGLDLQGGMHLAVEVDDPDGTLTPEARADAVDRTLTIIRNRIDEFGVREPTIQKVGDERIIVELAGIEDPERAKQIVERNAFLEFRIVTDGTDFRRALPRIDRAIVSAIGADELRQLQAAAPETAPEEPQDLSEILGGAEADTAGAAADTAAAPDTARGAAGTTEPGVEDTAPAADGPVGRDLRPLSAILLEGQMPGEFYVAEQDVPTAERFLALPEVQRQVPRGVEPVWAADPVSSGGASYRPLYILQEDPLLTGERLADAGPASRDPTFNRPIVPFETTRRGARIFERGTSRHVGDNMAIVLDGRVQSVAVIRQTLSRRAQIELGTGDSFQDAQDLALVLRAGALPVPIQIVEERTVGPSLGADSIRQGTIAFLIGIAAVLVLMIGYYKLSGVMAVGALAVYVVLVLGGLAGLGATLTLPGIAGLILSVGMAVDANVLIFERIREEIDAGKTSRTAVEAGFANALSAIVDANLTTLITGIILFQFGTGPVRGFAVTLCIGIIASFFSAIFVTRTFFMIYLDRQAPTEPVSI